MIWMGGWMRREQPMKNLCAFVALCENQEGGVGDGMSEIRDRRLRRGHIIKGQRLRGRRQANKSHLVEMMIESEDVRDV
jgi:hypothetical protein